ncbi:carboxylesterase/lipase family protein [Goekera deserti]|uniref:Carboxylic ester hydrolase n=1 Tax=Goekera deserti TaxID=2497753 RepID=A0A7K3WGD0_9ACTN|nr:carboxylesterase family protein [Goekera deserti]NDI47108.1 carboxylesterase family protein [Goekera deserti]NEL55494.1 carboxylesterase family protein [Goekera deserti]
MSTTTDRHVVGETSRGAVRGAWREGSAAFLGIPFAEPPFGDLRLLAPVRRAPWPGVRDALVHAPTPQRRALAEVTTIPEPSIPGEDVLTVDVFTPQPSGTDLLPVLVYVHGGGFVAGSPASPWYDGAAFNRDGVVTVTVSYRLGFEGFGWVPDAPANRGVLDWLLALEWVREEISAFGGDPRRVTIAGQSAGGGAVLTLLTLPRARGLFARALCMSGSPGDVPLAAAQATTGALAARLGVPADRAGICAVAEADLIEATDWVQPPPDPSLDDLLGGMRAMAGGRSLGPVVDGDLVPWTVSEGLRVGAGSDVPLLMGSTRGEFSRVPLLFRRLFDDATVPGVLDRLGLPPELAARYAAALPGSHPAEVVGQYISDAVFRRRVVEWAALRRGAAPTWVYDFAWPSTVSGIAEHCLDVPFAFDLLDDPDVTRVAGPDAPQSLADAVHGAVVAFATDGDPGWPSCSGDTEPVMVFDAVSGTAPGRYDSARVLAAR